MAKKKVGPKQKLSPKQAAFCREYLVDLNATQAAIRAKYSKKTAQQMGSENLSKPVIQAKIQELMEKRAQRTEIESDDVLADIREMADVAMARKPAYVSTRDEDGNMVCEEVYRTDIPGAKGHLELLGKHFKLFTDKVELDASDDFVDAALKAIRASKNTNLASRLDNEQNV